MGSSTTQSGQYHISGLIAEGGKGLAGATVTLFWQQLRTRAGLATGQSDATGNYSLTYAPPANQPGKILVLVEAKTATGDTPVDSKTVEIAAELTINLDFQPDGSEYTNLLLAVTPLLGALHLTDLSEDEQNADISYMARQISQTAAQVMNLVTASLLESAHSIPAAVFYAFLRQHIPSAIPADLLTASQNFKAISALITQLSSLIFTVAADVQQQTLETAISKKLIAPGFTAQLPAILGQLEQQRWLNALSKPFGTSTTPLGQLLALSTLTGDKLTAFAQALLTNTAPISTFWTTLADGKHGFTPAEAASAQQVMELGALVEDQVPVVKTLQARIQSGTTKTVADLAGLSKTDWEGIVTQSRAGAVPPSVTAIGSTTAVQVFAAQIYGVATSAYPTTALASRIGQGNIVPEAQRAPLTAFFAGNADLDLLTMNVDAYLAQQGAKAFTGIAAADQPGVTANVKRFQRVLQICSNVDTAQALLGLGLDSAAKIVVAGQKQFVTKVSAAGVAGSEAAAVYVNAEHLYAGALSLISKNHSGLRNVWPAALGDTSALNSSVGQALKTSPSLQALFGPQDFCAVDPSTSMLSPGAYLADLLLWLRGRDLTPAYTTLRDRRPDIPKIMLNAANTFSELPYIDVVNELLEDAVAPPKTTISKTTTLTPSELRAAPEYVNAEAYSVLAKARFPQSLPYDRNLDELRTSLRQSGVTLWQLRENLEPLSGAVPVALSAATAAERFQINAAELQLITVSNAVPLTTVWGTANPAKDLASVSAFLQQSGITYGQLLEMLQTTWLWAGGKGGTLTDVNDDCDTTQQTIGPIDDAGLDRIHRFLRLWRHVGWQMWELDLVLGATGAGAGALDAAGLRALFAFQRILDTTRLPVVQAAAFFSNIDTAAHRAADGTETVSLYEQLFLNPTVPPDSALGIDAMSTANPPAKLAAHLNSLGAALQVSTTDAGTLAGLTDGNLTLANLSLMYRVSLLANAAGLSITDLIGAAAIESTTFAQIFASPAATLAFIGQAAAVRKTGFTISALTYVLSTAPTTAGLTEAQLTTVLAGVQTAMQSVHGAIFTSTNPPATVKPPLTVLQTELAQLPAFSDATVLANAIAIVNGGFTGTADQSQAVTAAMVTFMTPAAAAAALYLPLTAQPTDSAGTLAEVNTRALAILTPLAVTLTQTQVIASLASGLLLKTDATKLLLSQLNAPGTTAAMMASFTDTALIAPGSAPYTNALTPTAFPNQFAALRLLDKIGTVVKQLSLVSADLSWLLASAPFYGGVDLTQLPVLASQPPVAAGKLAQTVLAVQLDRAFTTAANSTASPAPAIQSLFSLISGAAAGGTLTTASAIQSALAGITGWAATDIASLAGALGASLTPQNDYLNPALYDRLRTLQGMAAAAGGTGQQLVAWGSPTPDETAAQSARQALKAKYTRDAWLKIAPKISNPIRERSNAALRSWLIAQRDSKGAPVWAADDNELCDRFLIDVQMSSCELTSRIVQAYASVQLFVQRCLMNLEAGIVADPDTDDGWLQWDWMQRFQLWVANRKIFLYPENWLIGTERPNSSELFETLTQAAHQQENVSDNFEDILLSYVDGMDGIAHLRATGVCQDGDTTYVVARAATDPPAFYLRTRTDGIWTTWEAIPLTIKAHQVTPEIYGNNLYLFWPQVTTASEPQQSMPAAQTTNSASPSPPAAQHVEIIIGFSTKRNGKWAPVQQSKGCLYDMPLIDASSVSHGHAIEGLYTLKTVPSGSSLFLDVFRLAGGRLEYCSVTEISVITLQLAELGEGKAPQGLRFDLGTDRAVQVGRAIFDGRFDDLLQRNLPVVVGANMVGDVLKPPQSPFVAFMLERAQSYYGEEARNLILLPENEASPNLQSEPWLEPRAGALATLARGKSDSATRPLTFTSEGAMEQYVGSLLNTAPLPFRVVGPNASFFFRPDLPFVYSDSKRSYFVEPRVELEKARHYRIDYSFSRFYHPYTGLFWHQLSSSGVDGLYDRQIQVSPDSFEPGNAFSFSKTYMPSSGRTTFDGDRETVDFSADAAWSVYNWELFYHIPLYVAQMLSQNQQFEDARKWFHYIFNPTLPGKDPIPQRYWIPKPLFDLTSAGVEQQSINNLLQLVSDDQKAEDEQVTAWRKNPYDPYLIADLRPVAYMKNVFMSYLDNLIAWADNLFSSESREALNEATLLYVLASEILGPEPPSVTPPAAVDQSFDDLLPHLDAFADGLADIENVTPKAVKASTAGKGQLHAPQTFYFKVPPNDKLLGYWKTLADRLYKLRHCQNIQGGALNLALFDAPIDPGRLTGGGIDNSSVLSDVASPLPNYRFATCYAQAMDFCSAVRSYGVSLQAALEKSDADQLALLLATTQKQLLADADRMYQMKVDQAQTQIDALNQTLNLAQSRYNFYSSQKFMNAEEIASNTMSIAVNTANYVAAVSEYVAATCSEIPHFTVGASGFGASPVATATVDVGKSLELIAAGNKTLVLGFGNTAKILTQMGTFVRRQDTWEQSAAESQIQIDQARAQIAGAQLALQMAQLDQQNHQTQIDNLQQQIDLLTSRFTNQALYDWMVSQLSATYFQSYRLAYTMAKRAERCYGYELGLLESSFISFGYWDSLKKGLLSGEALNHDLRRMQASYLDLNVRRFEISRIVSLSAIAPDKLLQLLEQGNCDFDLTEALFDGDYPGHYQRRITRVSVTVVYPNPGKNDNVKCTLTLAQNSVRLTNDLSLGYPRVKAPGKDPRFTDSFGALQSIVTGNAQDDPGLFITTISANIADVRYLPFEGAGCISSWHLELPAETNDIDLTTVGDVLIHLYYTALDGGSQFKQAAQQALPVPTMGMKLFSAQNDFGAGAAAYAPVPAQGPVATPWQAFFTAATPPVDQELVLKVAASKFPNWTRGKTITITGLTVYLLSLTPGSSWVLEPQAPLAANDVTLSPVTGYPEVAAGTVTLAPGTAPGSWSFKLKSSTAGDWQSLKSSQLGDVLLLVSFTAS